MAYEALQEAVKLSGSNGGGENFDLLTADEKADVLAFIEWLKTTTMSSNSVNSYKSYVTIGMLKIRGVLEGKLTNDQKSGVRKFMAWYKSSGREDEVVEDDVELEDETLDEEG